MNNTLAYYYKVFNDCIVIFKYSGMHLSPQYPSFHLQALTKVHSIFRALVMNYQTLFTFLFHFPIEYVVIYINWA